MVSGMLIESKHFQSDTGLQNALLFFPVNIVKTYVSIYIALPLSLQEVQKFKGIIVPNML